MTPDTYQGFERDKIAENPTLQLAWDISQIVDDDAPLKWYKHVFTAKCLLSGYEMKRKGFG